MNKYVALALTVSFAIPFGLYLQLPVYILLVRFYPNIFACPVIFVISLYSLAVCADIVFSVVLFLLLTGRPIHPSFVILLSLVMTGIAWSLSFYSSIGHLFGILDLTMIGLGALILCSAILTVITK